MPANMYLVSKGLAFISVFLVLGFYTSHYLRVAGGDNYVHAGNLNDIGWTDLMGGEGEQLVRQKRHTHDSVTNDFTDDQGDDNTDTGTDSAQGSDKGKTGNGDEDDDEEGTAIHSMVKYEAKEETGDLTEGTQDNDDIFGTKDDTMFDADDDDFTDFLTEKEFEAVGDDDDDYYGKTHTHTHNNDDDDDDKDGEDDYYYDDYNSFDEDTFGENTEGTSEGMYTGSTINPTDYSGFTGTTDESAYTEDSLTEGTTEIVSTMEATTELLTTAPTTTETLTTVPPRDYMRTVDPDTLNKCQIQPFIIQDACPTDGDIQFVSSVNVTTEELGMVLFDSDVLSALENKCENSTWCLGPEYDKILWYSSQMFKSYCNFIPCLLEISDECLTEERRLYTATLIMLCEADLENVTNPCLLSMRRMSHVAFLNVFRSRDEEMSSAVCDSKNAKKCSGPCYDYSHQLYCTYDSCNISTMWIFQEYGPWQWLFNDVDKMETCEVLDESNNCTAFKAPDSMFVHIPDNFTARILAKIMNMGNKTGVGVVIVSFLVVFGIFGLVVYACVKKVRKDGYGRKGVEYSPLHSDDMEDA